MVHPCPGAPITAKYGQRGRYWSMDKHNDPRGWGIHTGLDFGAPAGTPIRAMTHGVVLSVAYDESYGYKVIVRYDGEDWWYCHMPKGGERVRVGQRVEAGQRIGTVGATGNVSGPHLHVERRRAGGGWLKSDLRDPAAGIAWRPKPIRIQSANNGQDNATGSSLRAIRQGPLLTDLLRPGTDLWLLQETPTVLRDYLDDNLPKRKRGRDLGIRRIGGEHGRYIYGGKRVKTDGKGGTITPSVHDSVGPRRATWRPVLIDGYQRRLVVNLHGPRGISYAKKRAYWRELWAAVDRIRIRLGLEWWQVIAGGDTNGPRAARVEAKRYGLRVSRARARKVTGRKYGTTNGWKPRWKVGVRLDVIHAHEDVEVLEHRNVRPRPIPKRPDKALTDHNRQVVHLRTR